MDIRMDEGSEMTSQRARKKDRDQFPCGYFSDVVSGLRK